MIEQIREILLRHQGKRNRVTSSQIADAIGINENATYAKTRALILECIKVFELPVAADTKGYYLITNQEEFDAYIENLNGRIVGIEERKNVIAHNFEKWRENQ